jgi:hypothetical protein
MSEDTPRSVLLDDPEIAAAWRYVSAVIQRATLRMMLNEQRAAMGAGGEVRTGAEEGTPDATADSPGDDTEALA